MISAKIIEDSICYNSGAGARIVTLQLCYPRFIHSEMMTHRVFSRNASSSRAIPVAKMIDMVRNDPAMPIHWGLNKPGMQADLQLIGPHLENAKELWLEAACSAAHVAEAMEKIGLHKQVANRILEPFQHIHVVVTATEWENFFALRAHPDAQPEIHELALQMLAAMEMSVPRVLVPGEWHLPYISEAERADDFYKIEANCFMLAKISAARCARVSYMKHDGTAPNRDEDLELYQRLMGMEPLHASPVEHQAMAWKFQSDEEGMYDEGENGNWSGNFWGWHQFRKLLADA